jgi:hypothetical protein
MDERPTPIGKERRAPFFLGLIGRIAERLDHRYGWSRLPRPIAIVTLIGLRDRLRRRNLFDTSADAPGPPLDPLPPGSRYLEARTIDGTYNDLKVPRMGSRGSRFGRNVPIATTWPEPLPGILEPSPRTVSRELLTRHEFIPASTLNLLAGAWLQFEVHDWLSHVKLHDDQWEVPLADDDDWPERPMRIERTQPDPTHDPKSGTPPTYITDDTHWWDGSQIYGDRDDFAAKVRTGQDGKLRIAEDGLPPADLQEEMDLSGVAGAFWVGLGLFHTLFMLEHNAICDRLRREYPTWTDDALFDKARLVNAALMAKIHTVEWTPAIIAHPTTVYAMHTQWWGLVGERARKRFGRIGKGEVLSGIPGSPTEHHGVPYSLTEEFVAVYRMHPLLPDHYTFRSVADDSVLQQREFAEIGALQARTRLQELTMPNALYSFGIANPGAITLHNFPAFLQNFVRPDGVMMDLAATDIMRIRERGVPRYNEFRRLFRLKPASSFEELSSDPGWVEELRRVYDGDVEKVDLMIGLYAERPPAGFGFSDTAFRVFILMASRRLKSDRYFTTDYTAKVYTQPGLDWINDNTFVSVLLRHYPQLEPSLRGVKNGFAPWNRVRA